MGERLNLGKVLITGAAGFIGTHLAEVLLGADSDLVLAARRPPEPGDARWKFYNPRWVALDVRERGAVEALLEAERPDTVFHLVGTRGSGTPDEVNTACSQVNVYPATDLMVAAKRTGVRRLVLAGSAEEYGRQPGPLNEDGPLQPETPYGLSKWSVTQLAQRMSGGEHCCPVTVIRPFTVYGPGQPRNMFVAQAVECAVSGQAFQMTAGTQCRDLVYVVDVVCAMIRAATAPKAAGRVINIGSGAATPLREVAALIWKLSESAAPLEIGARPSTPTELFDTWADIRLAERLLGWKPKVSLEAGLRQTIEWARKKAAGWTG